MRKAAAPRTPRLKGKGTLHAYRVAANATDSIKSWLLKPKTTGAAQQRISFLLGPNWTPFVCMSWQLGDGDSDCDSVCNNDACDYDAGECTASAQKTSGWYNCSSCTYCSHPMYGGIHTAPSPTATSASGTHFDSQGVSWTAPCGPARATMARSSGGA